MDPASLILSALGTAALKGLDKTVSSEIGATYAKLKQMVRSRLDRQRGGVEAYNGYERNPGVFEAPMRHLLQESGAADDPAILETARQLAHQAGARGGDAVNFAGNTISGSAVNIGRGSATVSGPLHDHEARDRQ